MGWTVANGWTVGTDLKVLKRLVLKSRVPAPGETSGWRGVIANAEMHLFGHSVGTLHTLTVKFPNYTM